MTEQTKTNGILEQTQNEEIKSVYSSDEEEIIYSDGRYARSLGHKRSTNPYNIPEAKLLWLQGWVQYGIDHRNKRQRERYWRKKHEQSIKTADESQEGREGDEAPSKGKCRDHKAIEKD